MKYLLDTNVISELIARQPNVHVLEWVDSLDPDNVHLSVITVGEIRKGIAKLGPSKRQEHLLNWLNTDLLVRFHEHIAEISTDVMLIWGEMAGRLEKEGVRPAAIDSLIAALALAGNYVLATRNERDFEGTGVTLINPWQ